MNIPSCVYLAVLQRPQSGLHDRALENYEISCSEKVVVPKIGGQPIMKECIGLNQCFQFG